MSETEDKWMRVLLFGNRTEYIVSVPNGFVVSNGEQNVEASFLTAPKPVVVRLSENRIQIGALPLSGPVTLRPNPPYVFFINGQGYRGNLILSAGEEPNCLMAINHVPLEAYLLGVVGAEMCSYWEPQALQAQTIAARTYALYVKNRFGVHRNWDVTTTQANQVYRGLAAESVTVRDAVEQTRGQILVCPDETGESRIFPAYYSSICGGYTEDGAGVFGERFSALSPVPCPFCQSIAKDRFWNWGPVEYSIEQVQQKLFARYPSLAEKLDNVDSVECVRVGQIGRVTGVSILGRNGKKDFLRGEDFRLALDPSGMKLKSAIFSLKREGIVYTFFDGRGFGHGVGLCQTGAENMARQGKTCREILRWYYPGATVKPD
jgi:stage II sporulation protein D